MNPLPDGENAAIICQIRSYEILSGLLDKDLVVHKCLEIRNYGLLSETEVAEASASLLQTMLLRQLCASRLG